MIQLDLYGKPLDKWERIQFIKMTFKRKQGYYAKCKCGAKILNLPRLFFCLDCQLQFYIDNSLIKDFFDMVEVVA